MRTLVLDQGYQPISAVPFARAIRYLTKGKAEVLEEYSQRIHPDWHAPAVVRLIHRIRPYTRHVRFSRQNVLARDGWRCQYCGARRETRELTFDHVLPRSRGGRACWENIVTACVPCNTHKADRTPEEARMALRKRPARPAWLPLFHLALSDVESVPVEWRQYWAVELEP